MGRQNIFTTLSVTSVIPTSMQHELIDFLVGNRQYLYPTHKVNEAFKTRFTGRTPISEIFQRLTAAGKDKAYGLIRLPSKSATLHEVVDMTFVPFDLLQLKEATPAFSKTLSLIPELNDKLVINVTDITRGDGEFSDITQFQWRVVRDFLSRSFYASSGNVWISPALVRYVAKVYSMTIGGQLANLFGLTPLMRTFLQTIFCLFFVGKMTSNTLAPAFIKAHAKSLNLYDSQDLQQIFAFVQDQIGKPTPETLEEVFKIIDAYGHTQLATAHGSRLNRAILNQRFASLHPEGRVSVISLEYPPYFLFLILLSLSGMRMGLSFQMKNMNLVKEGQDVVTDMLKSSLLTAGL